MPRKAPRPSGMSKQQEKDFLASGSPTVSKDVLRKRRTLLIDIETAPNIAFVWGLYGQNIAINQIQEPGYTLCFAAKWLGEKKVMFHSIPEDGKLGMVEAAHKLLSNADVVIHYNGSKFDIPTLNREFVESDFLPPKPFQEIDLLKTCRQKFRFTSNKLDYVAQQLIGEGKVQHKGMDLWRECMAGGKAAWRTMREYNIGDVRILERIYFELMPWIPNHPNAGAYMADGETRCHICGSTDLTGHGDYYTNTMRYDLYQCNGCGAWPRARTNNLPKEAKQSVLAGTR